MRNDKKAHFKFSPTYVEALHDRGLKLFYPNTEPVPINDCRDRNLLNSAPEQPFQSGYGVDFYPTIQEKAAFFYFSIVTGHIFGNGNKRTGVLVLDQFLTANGIFLNMSNAEAEKLATDTARYRELQETTQQRLGIILDAIRKNSFPISDLRSFDMKTYRQYLKYRRIIRNAQEIPIGVWRTGLTT